MSRIMSRRSRGYTLIEIMIAVVVLTIGATGILAMQGASVRSNRDASETSTAINWATTWVERIKRDARLWLSATGGAPGGNADLASTRYLLEVNTNPGVYVIPATVAPESNGADFYGFDSRVAANIRFCVNTRFTVAHAFNPLTQGVNPATDANAIRADVRVWWHRNSEDANRSLFPCMTTTLTNAQAALPQLRKHYLSTVVSWRTPSWL